MTLSASTLLSKNSFEIFIFVFNCRFYFVFLVVWNFLYNDPVSLTFHGKIDDPIFSEPYVQSHITESPC